MDVENDKETLEEQLSKQSEQLKSLQANNEALKNDVSEREQKIKLLESNCEQDQLRSKERSVELSEKDTQIRELQLQLDKMTNCLKDTSENLENAVKKTEREKAEREALQTEIQGASATNISVVSLHQHVDCAAVQYFLDFYKSRQEFEFLPT